LRSSLPPDLAPGLDEKWWETHLKSGPPKIKSLDLEGLDEILGVYYYEAEL
jgi:hypothetical protein